MSNMPYRLTQDIVRGSGNATAIRTEVYVTFSIIPDIGKGHWNRPRSLRPLHQVLSHVLAHLTLFPISNTVNTVSLNGLRINQSNAIEFYRQYSAHMFFKHLSK